MIAPIDDVIKSYLKSGLESQHGPGPLPRRSGQAIASSSRRRSSTTTAAWGSDFSCDEPVTIRLRFEVRQPKPGMFLSFYIQNLEGTRVLFSDIRDTDHQSVSESGPGCTLSRFKSRPDCWRPAPIS